MMLDCRIRHDSHAAVLPWKWELVDVDDEGDEGDEIFITGGGANSQAEARKSLKAAVRRLPPTTQERSDEA